MAQAYIVGQLACGTCGSVMYVVKGASLGVRDPSTDKVDPEITVRCAHADCQEYGVLRKFVMTPLELTDA